MTVVVTGASGFLGGALVREILESGQEVRAVDLTRGPTLEGLDVEFVEADVLDREAMRRAVAGAETVYHLVALISITGDRHGLVRTINVDGVRSVAEAALEAGVKRMVHCSSVHAFDLALGSQAITENSPKSTAPGLPAYDRSKAAGEEELRKVIDRGLDAVIVNPTGVIGPWDHAPSRMGQVFVALFNGTLPVMVDGGFDWVDSRDVARSALRAASSGRRGHNYLLPGHYRTIADLAAIAERVSGARSPKTKVPMRMAQAWSPIGDLLARRKGSALTITSEALHALKHCPPISGDKAAEELGHDPLPIEDTITDIYRWFSDRGLVHSSSS